MRATLKTCEGYRAIRDTDADDLPAECRREEETRADGWAVVALCGGRIVATADGWVEPERLDPFDLACERRYD